MNRWGPGLALALVFAHGSLAGGLSTSTQARSPTDGRCAALGQGFFAIVGSDACVRISGHISAGAGFGTGAARGESPGQNPLISAEAAAAGDLRFNTPSGPARVYLNVGNSAISRWMVDSQ